MNLFDIFEFFRSHFHYCVTFNSTRDLLDKPKSYTSIQRISNLKSALGAPNWKILVKSMSCTSFQCISNPFWSHTNQSYASNSSVSQHFLRYLFYRICNECIKTKKSVKSKSSASFKRGRFSKLSAKILVKSLSCLSLQSSTKLFAVFLKCAMSVPTPRWNLQTNPSHPPRYKAVLF